MKIMTYNVQHCRNFMSGIINYNEVARVIKESGADVVGLNEIRGEGVWDGYEAQTEKLAELTGFPYYYFAKAIDVGGEVNPYGNAILSKFPINSVEKIMIPDPLPGETDIFETRCFIRADIKGLTVLISHFGLSLPEQRNAVNTALSLINDNCVLMGDFNVKPDDELLTPIRERLKDSETLMEGNTLTYPSIKPLDKIDYIFHSSSVKLKSAKVIDTWVSDHRPIIVEVSNY